LRIASCDRGEASTSPAMLDDHVDADQRATAALEWALWANDLNDIVYLDDDDGLTPLCWPQLHRTARPSDLAAKRRLRRDYSA